MRSSVLAIALLSSISGAAATCVNDACLQNFQKYGNVASAYCVLYKEISGFSGLPSFMSPYPPAAISSACSCITTTSSTKSSTAKTSSTSSSSSKCVATSTTITSISTVTAAPSTVTQYSTVINTIISTEIDTVISTLETTETDVLTSTLAPLTLTAYVTVPTTVTAYSTILSTETDIQTIISTSISVSTLSTCPVTSSSSLVVSSSSATSSSSSGTTTVSVSSTSTSNTAVPCTVTAYSQIAPAVAAATCTAITLQDIAVPTNSTITLALKAGTVVTFAGKTTFAFTNSSTFNPITLSGAGITVQGAPGHVIDGNGQAYWDGIGSNGGVPKPDHFFVMSKVTANSVIQNLNIQNYPTHCFSISSCSNVLMTNITLDNSAGNAPNAISNGLPASHNSDGFDVSNSSNFTITNSFVNNQDDCVAITSGNNMTVSNMWCNGGHGMSIGSVGGKSNNNVTNILFTNSQILNSTNGPRIKSNYNTTGYISNITYSNIYVSNIATYGIDIQQDYLNGGPTGSPSNGVTIANLLFSNITGTAVAGATDYYILCGSGSCSNFVFTDVAITGGTTASSCNYPASGCPGS